MRKYSRKTNENYIECLLFSRPRLLLLHYSLYFHRFIKTNMNVKNEVSIFFFYLISYVCRIISYARLCRPYCSFLISFGYKCNRKIGILAVDGVMGFSCVGPKTNFASFCKNWFPMEIFERGKNLLILTKIIPPAPTLLI